jgi:geranylgeranyl pyrophosphate synthase
MSEAQVECSAPAKLAFPERFQGVFLKSRARYEPLLVEARSTLRSMLVPSEIAPYYSYGVLEHEQPSFVLAPLMYLAMAESQGGITARHRRYLPAFLLMVELIAVLDDTVDHTPLRSGRQTYWRRFGAPSAAPFSCFLFNAALERTHETAPELAPLVTRMFASICASEVWEHDSRYPKVEVDALEGWLAKHYAAVPAAIAHSLDSALVLHGREPLERTVHERFAELQQDVDDIVNFVEKRERDGENDDVKMGIVTHPLLAAVRNVRAAERALEALWSPRREHASDDEAAAVLASEEVAAYATLAQAIEDVGIPVTLHKIADDANAAIVAASPVARPCVADLVWTFVERLCRVEALRPRVESICPAVQRLR